MITLSETTKNSNRKKKDQQIGLFKKKEDEENQLIWPLQTSQLKYK